MDSTRKLLKLRKRRFVLEKVVQKLIREEEKVQGVIDNEKRLNEINRIRRQKAYELQAQSH